MLMSTSLPNGARGLVHEEVNKREEVRKLEPKVQSKGA
jgi:hypothetical protein